MRKGRALRPALPSERGFTLVELVTAIFLLLVGVLSLVSTFDSSRALTTKSERREAAVHVAQREVERVRSLAYRAVALRTGSVPQRSSDANDPSHLLSQDGMQLQWDPKQPGNLESLVVAADGGVEGGPTRWQSEGASGQIYRFVTWTTDAACSSACGTQTYKRVTVGVTMDGGPKQAAPVMVSTIISDPDDGSADATRSPRTECLNASGELAECKATAPGQPTDWSLLDTPATSSSRQEPTASHATHPTVAPSPAGSCTGGSSTGCPVPDLMTTDPIPSSTPVPSLYKYSTDITGGYPGGRALRRDTTCTGSPSTTDNTKGERWVTPPLTQSLTLTGAGGLVLYTQTIDGAAAGATLCVAFYDVPGDISNLVAQPATEIGRTSYSLTTWPAAVTRLSFTFDFLGSAPDATLSSGHRLGVRLWVASSAGADIAVLYDHQTYPSVLELVSPAS